MSNVVYTGQALTKIKSDNDKGTLPILNLIKMCSLDSEMWPDRHESVLSFHTSYAKNVQRGKKNVSGQNETDGSRSTSGIFQK